MANVIYASVIGEKQGLISSGCGTHASIGNKYQSNHRDEIFVLQFDHSMSRERNVIHHPVKFYKPIDKSSPLLSSAISGNEELSVVFDFYRTRVGGVLNDIILLIYNMLICIISHHAIHMYLHMQETNPRKLLF